MNGRHNPRLSPHGAFSLSLSAFFLAEGLLRGELIATLTGAFLAALNAFALLTVMAARFRWNRFSPEIEKGEDGLYSLVCSDIPARSFMLGPTTFFATVAYRLTLRSASYGDTEAMELPLPDAFSGTRPALPPRGRYTVEFGRCAIRDFAGFFSVTTSKSRDLSGRSLIVPPGEGASGKPKPAKSAAGNADGASSYLRSQELYEIRQFRPGDDRRKINWKAFAHTGELLTREGELLPPPSREYTVLFWAPPGDAADKAREIRDRRALDLLVSRSLSMCVKLLQSGKNLRFPQAGNRLVRHDDRLAREHLQYALTYPALHDIRRFPSVHASPSGGQSLVFTLPPSERRAKRSRTPERNRITADLPGPEAPLSFFVGPVGHDTARRRRRGITRVLFFDEDGSGSNNEGQLGHYASTRDMERFIAILERGGFNAYPL